LKQSSYAAQQQISKLADTHAHTYILRQGCLMNINQCRNWNMDTSNKAAGDNTQRTWL